MTLEEFLSPDVKLPDNFVVEDMASMFLAALSVTNSYFHGMAVETVQALSAQDPNYEEKLKPFIRLGYFTAAMLLLGRPRTDMEFAAAVNQEDYRLVERAMTKIAIEHESGEDLVNLMEKKVPDNLRVQMLCLTAHAVERSGKEMVELVLNDYLKHISEKPSDFAPANSQPL